MSKALTFVILGSSTSKPQHLAYAQDCLLYISGSFIVFYNRIALNSLVILNIVLRLLRVCVCLGVRICCGVFHIGGR